MNGTNTEKFAFKMQLNQGGAEAYQKRHDKIWPELIDLLYEAGISDYCIFLDEETHILFGVLRRTKNHKNESAAGAGSHATLVEIHG
jgi:L-rhamnose mutarotase